MYGIPYWRLNITSRTIRAQLDATRTEYASLRSTLQDSDSFEPKDIVEPFRELNRNADNVCADITDIIADQHELSDKRISDPQRKFRRDFVPDNLIQSPDNEGRQADLFLTIFLRYRVCSALHEIMEPFHPSFKIAGRTGGKDVSEEVVTFVNQCYESMRPTGMAFV